MIPTGTQILAAEQAAHNAITAVINKYTSPINTMYGVVAKPNWKWAVVDALPYLKETCPDATSHVIDSNKTRKLSIKTTESGHKNLETIFKRYATNLAPSSCETVYRYGIELLMPDSMYVKVVDRESLWLQIPASMLAAKELETVINTVFDAYGLPGAQESIDYAHAKSARIKAAQGELTKVNADLLGLLSGGEPIPHPKVASLSGDFIREMCNEKVQPLGGGCINLRYRLDNASGTTPLEKMPLIIKYGQSGLLSGDVLTCLRKEPISFTKIVDGLAEKNIKCPVGFDVHISDLRITQKAGSDVIDMVYDTAGTLLNVLGGSNAVE